MQRTKDKDDRTRFRKIGGGSFIFHGRRIKRNETFLAYPEEIPTGVRDLIVDAKGDTPLAVTEKNEPAIPPEQVRQPEYKLSSRGGGWFDVVDEQGKKMNDEEKSLRREEALKLIKELNG